MGVVVNDVVDVLGLGPYGVGRAVLTDRPAVGVLSAVTVQRAFSPLVTRNEPHYLLYTGFLKIKKNMILIFRMSPCQSVTS